MVMKRLLRGLGAVLIVAGLVGPFVQGCAKFDPPRAEAEPAVEPPLPPAKVDVPLPPGQAEEFTHLAILDAIEENEVAFADWAKGRRVTVTGPLFFLKEGVHNPGHVFLGLADLNRGGILSVMLGPESRSQAARLRVGGPVKATGVFKRERGEWSLMADTVSP